MAAKVDDVKFIGEIMDTMIKDYKADPEQIFVTGHSNGAAMTQRIGCELGSRVRGVVPLMGFMGSRDFAERQIKDSTEKGVPGEVTPGYGTKYTPSITKEQWRDETKEFYKCPMSGKTDWLIITGTKD